MFLLLKIAIGICFLIIVISLVVNVVYRRVTVSWPEPAYRTPKHKPSFDRWGDNDVYITWIGHSTLLIRMSGVNILTDPVFSSRVGMNLPFFTIGPKRHVAPAITLDECPPIDVVLLSHAHMDHVDYPSLKRVIGPNTEVVTAPGTARLIRRFKPGAVHELSPDQTLTLASGVTVVGQQVKHWGSRYPWNKDQGYLGYVMMRDGASIFFAGDTAYTPDLGGVRAFNPQVTCMPIGAYAPAHFKDAHCTPEEAWDMFLATGAAYLVPMHHDTFVLSKEPPKEPLERLEKVAGEMADAIVIHHHGETFSYSLPDQEI
ncbi:MBL fold metallo-hydrolase [Alicyclobacillus dauci]|uniref:MBL fold metallo-hydrolase n=1 Tax=Alicyclobacillus dauci TaxID=1475485 RepID=A0ABY6YYP9_9BACL|nr:MBL fold metallo-hydrolase [Alicyclobacillus dauci]WAH35753.1 MBL fold metallo-hydrolase [Alicyclobacillus dauci]